MKQGTHHSEASRRKMREKASHDPRPPEIGKKISETKMKGFHPFRGNKLSESHKKNISESMRKRMNDIEGAWEEKNQGVEVGANVGRTEDF